MISSQRSKNAALLLVIIQLYHTLIDKGIVTHTDIAKPLAKARHGLKGAMDDPVVEQILDSLLDYLKNYDPNDPESRRKQFKVLRGGLSDEKAGRT